MRPSWIEVDLRAVAANVAAFVGHVDPAEVWTVVKADGYGHGDVPVAMTALEAGAVGLCVALAEEGIRLREAGIEAPILILSEPPYADLAEVAHWNLIPTVYRHAALEAILAAGADHSPVAVKVDTGMHRVGAQPGSAIKIAQRAVGLGLELHSVWTHLAVADEDDPFTDRQLETFRGVVAGLNSRGVTDFKTHVANTAGALLHPDAITDTVRIGLGTYGLYPCDAARPVLALQPALRVVSHVSLLRRLPAGSRPSYGRIRELPVESTVATVPIGYADGMPRLLSTRGGEVLIGGKRFPLAGTVTMDQIMVDVGDDDIHLGDEVVLVGRQHDEEIGVDEWAAMTGTISYEIVTGFGPRLPRRYEEWR